jgi:hypothetical protein
MVAKRHSVIATVLNSIGLRASEFRSRAPRKLGIHHIKLPFYG